MPQGLQVFNGSGLEELSLTTRIPKILGTVAVNSNGSLAITVPAGNTPFAMFVPDAIYQGVGYAYPSVKIVGSVIQWSYSNRDYAITSYVPGTITYGCY